MKKILFVMLVALFSASLFAQTQTFNAPTGNITPTFVVTMNLELGGSATLYVALSGCYFPGPCGSTTSSLTYSLPDGSTARFDHNVSLSFTNVAGGYYGTYVIEGSALSTLDSQGRAVTLPDVAVIMEAHRCIQPRGTCPPKKVYLSGTLTIQ